MAKNRAVLVVDDDLDVLFFVDDLLRELGFQPLKVTTAGDAVETLRTAAVEAVIVDFDLIPTATLQTIEELSDARQITPVLVMADDSIRPEGDSSPLRCFIEHPPDLAELREAIAHCLGSTPLRGQRIR